MVAIYTRFSAGSALTSFSAHVDLPQSLIPLLDMALKVYHGPHTFDELGISAYEPQEGKA